LNAPKGHDLSGIQKTCLVILRFAIGWHLMSEGIGKFQAISWSSAGYLHGSFGPFSELFKMMLTEQNAWMLKAADLAVTYGLIVAGAMLLLGVCTRLGCVVGIGLVALFYVSMPPWEWTPRPGTESNYLIVNKNTIEILALVVVAVFPTGRFAGLDAILQPLAARILPTWLVGVPSKEA
jgi:thiosulfate dehydrogenase [quinone] large subunit